MLVLTVLVTQTLMLALAFMEKKHIEEISINLAALYHVLMTVSFGFGALFLRNPSRPSAVSPVIEISNYYYYIAFFLITLGLLTSVLTVSYVYPTGSYLKLLFNYKNNYDELRVIKGLATSGGISGIFKVLNYSPLAVFFATAAFLQFFNIKKRERRLLVIVLVYAFLCSVLKTFFSLDRLTLLGVVIVFAYRFFFVSNRMKILLGIGLGLILLLLSFITSAKMANMDIFDFLKLYCQLGLTNFELVIQNQESFSLGFNTVLMPIYFVAIFFGYQIHIPQASSIIWDNAQYLYGYLYIDFGRFAVVAMFVIGIIVAKYQQFVNLYNRSAISIFFVVFFTVITFVVVPIIRGVEFWWLLIVCILLSRFIKIKNI